MSERDPNTGWERAVAYHQKVALNPSDIYVPVRLIERGGSKSVTSVRKVRADMLSKAKEKVRTRDEAERELAALREAETSAMPRGVDLHYRSLVARLVEESLELHPLPSGSLTESHFPDGPDGRWRWRKIVEWVHVIRKAAPPDSEREPSRSASPVGPHLDEEFGQWKDGVDTVDVRLEDPIQIVTAVEFRVGRDELRGAGLPPEMQDAPPHPVFESLRLPLLRISLLPRSYPSADSEASNAGSRKADDITSYVLHTVRDFVGEVADGMQDWEESKRFDDLLMERTAFEVAMAKRYGPESVAPRRMQHASMLGVPWQSLPLKPASIEGHAHSHNALVLGLAYLAARGETSPTIAKSEVFGWYEETSEKEGGPKARAAAERLTPRGLTDYARKVEDILAARGSVSEPDRCFTLEWAGKLGLKGRDRNESEEIGGRG